MHFEDDRSNDHLEVKFWHMRKQVLDSSFSYQIDQSRNIQKNWINGGAFLHWWL